MSSYCPPCVLSLIFRSAFLNSTILLLVTEQYAKLGFGAVLIDQQHGLLDERTAFECVQRLEKFPDCFPIVRVCDNSTALISRALDAGACGIIAPMINNPQEAKSLVDQCRYIS